MTRPVVPHPGSACCDPTQDLAGWLDAQRKRATIYWRWSRMWRQRAGRINREARRALVSGDRARFQQLDAAARATYGMANVNAQHALLIDGEVERIAEAHTWRLQPSAPADGTQLDLFGEAA